MILVLVVALAGGGGAALRYLADGAVQDRVSGPFPYGTLAVNLAGSLVLGFATGMGWYHAFGVDGRAVLGIGFCGGLTTWSTASWESVRLVESRLFREAFVYTLGGLVAALAVAAGGMALAAAL